MLPSLSTSRWRRAVVAVLWHLGNGLQTVTNLVYRAMDAVEDVDKLPRCPDCKIHPDVGDDCPVCAEAYERRLHEDAMYTAGHNDGWEAAEDKYRDVAL